MFHSGTLQPDPADTAVLQPAQLQGARCPAPCSVCPRTSQRVLGGKVPFTRHYLLHNLSQGGPQQLLCFLFQLLLKFLIFMNWKIFISRLFATLSLLFFFSPLPSLPATVQNSELYCRIAFPKQEVQLSKHLFCVLMACCQRARVVVSNRQKNK